MTHPTATHSHLWNDLPIEERKRLMPFMIQSQINHIRQCRKEAVLAHESFLSEIDAQIVNLGNSLSKLTEDQ